MDRDRRAPQERIGIVSVRVVVADDQEIVRTGLTMILNAQPGITVVGQAADGHRAVELARSLRPDVCLFDIRMPGTDGIEATRLLNGAGVADPPAIVVITTFDLDEYVHAALKAGARGFLLKDAGPDMLAQAVHAAARGDALIAPSITARLLSVRAHRGGVEGTGAAGRGAHPPRGGRRCRGGPGTDQRRDRRRAAHQSQHGQEPCRAPDGQARRPQPRRDRDVGLRDGPRRG